MVLREPLQDENIMAIANHIIADVSSKEGWSSAVRLEASLGTLRVRIYSPSTRFYGKSKAFRKLKDHLAPAAINIGASMHGSWQ